MIYVVITKHALERLFERFPKHKKFDVKVVANIVENVIKDGVILRNVKEVRISTSNYTLCCALEDKLVVKTIMKTKEMSERYRKAMIYAEKSPWKDVFIVNSRQIERWCEEIKKMVNVCKICGISKEQTAIDRCDIYGFYVCSFCCISIGGYSEKCMGCGFYKIDRKSYQHPIYIA